MGEDGLKEEALKKLVDVVKRLRAEDGCPWDRVQTHDSLCSYIKEEAYEVIDAIQKQDMENLKEELGDVLLQVVMHSCIAEEQGEFTLEEVLNGVCDKMIYRHPNVFGEEKKIVDWDELKRMEKGTRSLMDEIHSVPLALPACIRAQKIQKKAEKAGYWKSNSDKNLTKVEIGKQLFLLLDQARIMGIHGEEALEEYTKNFVYKIEHKKTPENL